MEQKLTLVNLGQIRTVAIPTAGAYDLVTGQGYDLKNYDKSSWAYSCIGIRADAVGRIPWRLTRNDKLVEQHPCIDMLKDVNKFMNWVNLIQATEIDLLMKGAAYWLKNGSEIFRLNPGNMKVKKTAEGIEKFIYTVNGKETGFNTDEIVYFRDFNPSDDLGPGVAPIDVCKKAIDVEYYCTRYVSDFFENGAMPGFVLETEDSIPETQKDRIVAFFKKTFGAKKGKNLHKFAIMDKGMKVSVLTSELDKMALDKVRDQARRDICVAFRVPMILVGAMDAATYSNAAEARVNFYEDVIFPRVAYLASVINSEFIWKIDESVNFEFATEELQILQEDENKKAERLVLLKEAGILKPEFVAEELGYPMDAVPVQDESVDKAVDALRAWKKKATKALKNGKSPNVDFETEDIGELRQFAIRTLLEKATTQEEIDNAFEKK
jgi:HK97 family phage portal protein